MARLLSAGVVHDFCKHIMFRSTNSLSQISITNESSCRRTFSRVGFIGLGNMGAPMAKNLIKKGYKLFLYDAFPEAIDPLLQDGAIKCASASDTAEHSDCIITMLPNDECVLETYQGKSGILESVSEGSILIDCSTVDPGVSKLVANAAEQKNSIFFDAPVSGGIMAAASGSLTFIVGGNAKNFPEVCKILQAMGSKIFHCGPVGSGQTAKICNNMLTAISMIGTAEAMNLGIKLGLDPKTLMDVINSCSGRCWSSEIYNPVPGTIPNIPSSKNYEVGFLTKLMTKDLNLAQKSALHCDAVTPLGALAHQIYHTMVAHGYSDKDFSVVYQFLKGYN